MVSKNTDRHAIFLMQTENIKWYYLLSLSVCPFVWSRFLKQMQSQTRNQPPWMGRSQGERPLSKGSKHWFSEILTNGAGQKKTKKTKMTHVVLICKQTKMFYSWLQYYKILHSLYWKFSSLGDCILWKTVFKIMIFISHIDSNTKLYSL